MISLCTFVTRGLVSVAKHPMNDRLATEATSEVGHYSREERKQYTT